MALRTNSRGVHGGSRVNRVTMGQSSTRWMGYRVMRMRMVAVVGLAATVSACAPSFTAQVARFQVLPPPAAQSFTIQPLDPAKVGSIEFATFAGFVRQGMLAHGFVEAPDPATATFVAKFDYGVGPGRTMVESTPGWGPAWGSAWGPGYGWGRYGGWGGWGGWGGGAWGAPQVYSVTTYAAWSELHIDRAVDKTSLFEGRAQTNSSSNALTSLVPNLVRAMFTNFPGVSGETVTIRFNPNEPPVWANPAPVAAAK